MMQRWRLAVLTVLLAALGGCASLRGPSPPPPAAAGEAPHFVVMPVFFATNRARSDATEPEGRYENRTGALSYGRLSISVPYRHSVGAIERPGFFESLIFEPDPRRHFTVRRFSNLTRDELMAQIGTRMRAEAAPGARKALIFVHGYNVAFDMAAFRTAQMSYDIGFAGAPVFYSWPSAFKEALYTHDASRIEESRPLIKQFISDVITRSAADRVYIVAHSMGTRGVSRALAELAREHPEQTRKIAALILAAPDINATVFRNDIAPHLRQMARSVTLYASSEDRALAVSRGIAGAPALGDASGGMRVFAGMDSIDASRVGTSFLGHSDYGDSPFLLNDIAGVIAGRRPLDRTWLRRKAAQGGSYFEFARLN